MHDHWLTLRSNRVLVPLAILAALGMIYVEHGKRVVPSPWQPEMLEAAKRSDSAARHLKQLRLEHGVFVDAINDPAGTALIGQEYTQITTDRGNLEAKLVSTDPNFAAVVVDMLRELQIEDGACAAVGMTGSFPALNLSTLVALEVLGMKVAAITSVGSSNFGANDPFFTWLDMEREVAEKGFLSTRSLGASLGGGNDTGRGLSPKGRELLRDAIERNGLPLIEHGHLEASVQDRLRTYEKACGDQGVGVYINIGGGSASLGHALNSDLIPTGPSALVPSRNFPQRGVLLRLHEKGVPVIHLLNIRTLRNRYGLEAALGERILPGKGEVFGRLRYRWLRALMVVSLLLGVLGGLLLIDGRVHRLGKVDAEAGDPAGSNKGS